MIKIERNSPPKGTILDRKKKEEYQKIKKQIKNQRETAKPKKLKFNHRLWSDPEVKEFLHCSQHGKCCYCERDRGRKYESDVEHFRPKGKVEENDQHPGYWWLAYKWDNLLIACKKCNEEIKKAKFPLMNEDNRVFDETGDIDKEEPYLINPLKENPEDFIKYELSNSGRRLMAKAIGRCDRGEKTVNCLTSINRRDVLRKRAKKLLDYERFVKGIEIAKRMEKEGIDKESCREYIESFREYIDRHTSPDSEFTGFARFYFKSKGYL